MRADRLAVVESPSLCEADLALIAEQIWPGLDGPDLRVVGVPGDDPQWSLLEAHRVLLWRGVAGMVLPSGRRAASRCLVEHARLRPTHRRIERSIWGALVGLGAPGTRGAIGLEVRGDALPRSPRTVVQVLRDELGRDDLAVAMAVRRTANRKAVLQVVDSSGATLGFAKLGWNEISSRGVHAESNALRQRRGGVDSLRTPRVLLDGKANGFPFVLMEPLPSKLRRIGVNSSEGPSAQEFAAVAPVTRHDIPANTGHIRRLRKRLSALDCVERFESYSALLALLEVVEQESCLMPVGAGWHGDFAYWNVGRAPDGTLWCWDFENAEEDALVGLDVLHWHASRLRTLSGPAGLSDGLRVRRDGALDLHALGLDEHQIKVVHRLYVVEIVARTLEMVATDGWDAVWASPGELDQVARSAAG